MIGEKIREIREERGISINELSLNANVSKSYISSIERGLQKNPSLKILKQIADALRIPIDEFIKTEEVHEGNYLDKVWLSLLSDAVRSGLTKREFMQFTRLMRYKREEKA
ncbi:helix-turn-helix domain-containing protein [Bacillus sp. 2205SS5-2]|uniref:helix-turn-helix domain-containing protein n=1 Tax=Bacillus sp. 2205SS5-2 TaxID=3109031 RepID=UPI00300612DF